ncbi:hypothetical protein ACQ4PT_021748 [Festuca glaucescens]
MDVVTASPDIHQHDLVSFWLGLRHRGVVEAEGTEVDTFQILRLDNSVVTKKASDLTVIDRSYLNIAQVVASASNEGGQIGVVTGATTVLDLLRLDERGEVVEAVNGVSPSRLRRVRALGLGDLVVSGPWLGQKNSRFYPGLRVASNNHHPTTGFKDARWLRRHWNADRDVAIGTVVKVEMSSVLVHWIASTHCGTDRLLVEESAPPAYQNPHDLTFFYVAYNNCGWAPADRCFFTEPGSTHGDTTFAHDRQLEEEQQHDACLEKVELPMTIAKTRTYVDVLWQDGTRQHGVPSESMVPLHIMNDQEFLPDGGTKPARRVGVVRTVCCRDQTVNVSWFKATACPSEAREVECNETVSAYDLELHPGELPDLGDNVVRLLPSGSSDRGTSIQSWSNTNNNADLSWVGHVIDLPGGHVQVKWGDGSISTDSDTPNLLSSLVVVDLYRACCRYCPMRSSLPTRDYMVSPNEEIDEDSGTEASEEPTAANTDNDPSNPAEDGDAESDSGEANEDGTPGTFKGRFSSFIWSLLRFTGEVLSRGKGFLTIWPLSWFPSSKSPVATKENLGAGEKKNATDAISGDLSFCFSHFDILHSPPDHHYIDIADEGTSRGKRWSKTVQKEWKILEKNLPETIYVRAFEDRMDLLRAVMVGASGTPYQDGLFFFDLQLPPSYPAVPPQVYYHSFGLRLNPNLYESGTVCHSLLNTFGGEGTEVWSPAASSLVQVLVSIQGLVLNDQPYYNEDGYETLVGTPLGRRNTLPYNESTFLTLRVQACSSQRDTDPRGSLHRDRRRGVPRVPEDESLTSTFSQHHSIVRSM